MIGYRDFLEAVTTRARLGHPDDAKAPIKAVLAGVAHWVDAPQREAVAEVLPLELRYVVEAQRPTVGGDLARFLQFVGFVTDTSPARARYDTQAVLSYLDTAEPTVARQLRTELPADFIGLFSAPPEGPAPDRFASADATPPAELTAEELAAVLRRLPGWRGNTRRLTRTVSLSPGTEETVTERIRRAEEQLNHHAQLSQQAGDVTFTLWTHSRDVVTELDIQLAERISDILERR
jgi:pterin-4a-carbinolamine dehydratase/uncharacterized protein (DUF2267 family)